MERTRRIAPLLIVLVFLLGSGLATGDPAPAAGVPTTVTVVGDSLTVGTSTLATALEADGWLDARVDAKVGRHITASTTDMSGILTIRAMRAAGWDSADWVVALGTNDTGYFTSATATETHVQKIVDEIGAGHRIAFVELAMLNATVVSDRFNAVVRAWAAAQPDRFRVVSWNASALANPGWFASDGVHLNSTGYKARTSAIVNGLHGWLGSPSTTPSTPTTSPTPSTPSTTPTPSTSTGSKAVPSGPMPVVVGSDADGIVLAPNQRVVDTRAGQGISGSLAAGAATPVDLAAGITIPAGATAVVVNLTTDRPAAAGYLSAGPCASVGATSVQNFGRAPDVVASLAVVQLDPAGTSFCVLSSARTDLLVDVVGWLAPQGGVVSASPAGRVYDSRSANRATTHRVVLTPPVDATGAVVNVTVDQPSAPGYVTVAPCDTAVTGSNANFSAGETVANLSLVTLTAEAICVTSSVPTHVLIDVVGYVGLTTATPTISSAGSRVLDTRNSIGGWSGRLAAGQRVDVDLVLPEGATSVLVQATATGTTTGGYLTVYDCSDGQPATSNLNPTTEVDRSNLALVALDGGDLCVMSTTTRSDVVIDVMAVLRSA